MFITRGGAVRPDARTHPHAAARRARRTVARTAAVAGAALLACAGLAACSSDGQAAADDGTLQVTASFYPLEYAVERIGGDLVQVTDLTQPGAEPHELELTAGDVATVAESDLVVYLASFQPAVDDAVASEASDRAFDVSQAADLTLTAESEEGGGTVTDPHFWLDPVRYAAVVDAVAARLGEASPEDAATFTANAKTFTDELGALDTSFSTGLATCTSRRIVTSHEAFGYLAERYDLEQMGIAGLSPENEPDAATLAEVAETVKAEDVSVIFYETLVSPDIAEAVAAETGATTDVLDPIESITDASEGSTYGEVMTSNLSALQQGLGCK